MLFPKFGLFVCDYQDMIKHYSLATDLEDLKCSNPKQTA